MMAPITVLRYLRRDHKEYFRTVMRAHGGQAEAFRKALGEDYAPAEISKLWNDAGRASQKLLNALSKEVNVSRLSDLFGWDLSACRDEADIEGRIRPGTPARSTTIRIHDQSLPGIEPSQAERVVLLAQATRICDLRGPICYDFSDHETGIVALTPIMMECEGFATRYRSLVFLHSGGEGDAFEAELKQYLRTLGIHPSLSLLGAAVQALEASRDLLVLNGTQVLDNAPRDGKHFVTALIHALRERGAERTWARGPVILASGMSTSLKRRVSPTDSAILETQDLKHLNEREANLFLAQQWLRFCKFRGVDLYGAPGSRVTRARWHYRVARQSGQTINIRARAFFASNVENQAFFDPTGGFDALAGMGEDDLPIDIFLFKKSIQGALGSFLRRDEPATRFARFISTSKHWLTKDALKDLSKRYSTDGRDLGSTFVIPNAKQIAEAGSEWKRWVHFDEGRSRFTMGIVSKALIQDAWRTDEGYDRRLAHYRVAKRIWEHQDDKRFLSREFPYKPHWGRSRIHLLAEVIRHLSRACDGAANRGDERDPSPDLDGELAFPLPPRRDAQGSFSGAAVDFCYRLFDEELNGHRYSSNARALTRRHGAQALAKEVLQLLGGRPDGFGRAPTYMNPKLRTRFTAECGYTALALGELDVADRCFASLSDDLSGASTLQLIEARLDLSLVQTAADDLHAAGALLARVEGELAATNLEAKDLNQLRRRVKARQLQVLYHSRGGNRHELAAEFRKYDSERRIKEIELLRCSILILEETASMAGTVDGASNRPSRYDAVSRCLSDAFTKASDGQHHDAMTLKILLASLMRKRDPGDLTVAEAMLDHVFQDIVAYGCAEVTLVRFLLEAAENLSAQGRLYRAYCVYLRRCHRRARARRFPRETKQAAGLAMEILKRLRTEFESYTLSEIECLVKREAELDQTYLQDSAPSLAKEPTRRGDEHDPLYGFSMTDDHGEERWLSSVEDIDREIIELLRGLGDGAASRHGRIVQLPNAWPSHNAPVMSNR